MLIFIFESNWFPNLSCLDYYKVFIILFLCFENRELENQQTSQNKFSSLGALENETECLGNNMSSLWKKSNSSKLKNRDDVVNK